MTKNPLYRKVTAMEPRAVAENLEVIRTLMERTALYRRTLAPIMLLLGSLGIAGAIGGVLVVRSSPGFVLYWLTLALVAVAAAFTIMRRQSLADGEPFWSPPTRRVALAMAPALAVGVFVSLPMLAVGRDDRGVSVLPGVWMLLYGCALHAAGFFMERGIRWLGWTFVVCGAASYWWGLPRGGSMAGPSQWHFLMGLVFGGGQLAYGIYLRLTERKNGA